MNMIPRRAWYSQHSTVVKRLSPVLTVVERMLNVCIVGSGVAGLSTARRLIKVNHSYKGI